MRKEYSSRLLAVDIRSRRIGYALFEMPERLLDSGITRFATAEIAAVRIANLCEMFRPSVIVLRKEAARHGRSYSNSKTVRRALRNEAVHRLIPIIALRQAAVQNWFHQHGNNGKYAIASFLANRFPELWWKLPPRRSPWQPEPWSLCLFDAVALGVVCVRTDSRARLTASLVPD
jgi:hypothetical protein